MKAQIPWLRVFVEGVVIVVSILLAFGIDAWWAGIESRRDAHRELGTVLEEMHEARAQLQVVALWRERELSAASSVQSRLEGASPDEPIALPDTLFALSFGVLLINDAPTQAAAAFVTSGHVDEVEDVELRRALLAWTSALADLRDDEVRFGTEVVEQLLDDFYDRASLGWAWDLIGAAFLAGPLAPAASGSEDVLVTYSTRARNLSAYWTSSLRLLSRETAVLLDQADEAIGMMERELD